MEIIDKFHIKYILNGRKIISNAKDYNYLNKGTETNPSYTY